MKSVQVKRTVNYFIENTGRIIKIEYGKEVEVIPWKTKRSKKMFVMINGKPMDYLLLMIEHFKPEISQSDKIVFKVQKNGRIPESAIKVKPFIFGQLSNEEVLILHEYKCVEKSTAANSRSQEIITPLQVYTSLKIHNFHCVYCNDEINPKDWHLDHFLPLARHPRQNTFGNIVPACPDCNNMKGSIEPQRFFRKCQAISKSYMFQNDMSFKQPINNNPKGIE